MLRTSGDNVLRIFGGNVLRIFGGNTVRQTHTGPVQLTVEMDQLAPQHVPLYETPDERARLWDRCSNRGQPVVAIRVARRGYIVRYDLQHLSVELSDAAVQQLRERVRDFRTYPTGTDPLSESEGVGGEAGPVSGDLHAASESVARNLASRLSAVVFDQTHWISTQAS